MRRSGPVWKNHEYVKSELQMAVAKANEQYEEEIYVFKDVGFAEDVGLDLRTGCYKIREQLLLWATSWLVVSPHGAHDTNLMFMSKTSGGFVEGLACGHQTRTFLDLAKFAQVPYHDAHEQDNGNRHNCRTDQGRKYLDKPRTINFTHDTMLAVVNLVLSAKSFPSLRNNPSRSLPSEQNTTGDSFPKFTREV